MVGNFITLTRALKAFIFAILVFATACADAGPEGPDTSAWPDWESPDGCPGDGTPVRGCACAQETASCCLATGHALQCTSSTEFRPSIWSSVFDCICGAGSHEDCGYEPPLGITCEEWRKK